MSAVRDLLLGPRVTPVELSIGRVFVRSLTLAEGWALIDDANADPNGKIRRVIAAAMANEDGSLVFNGPDDPGIDAIPEATAFELLDAINSARKPKSIEETAKN